MSKSISHIYYNGCYKLIGSENEQHYKKLMREIAPDFHNQQDCVSGIFSLALTFDFS